MEELNEQCAVAKHCMFDFVYPLFSPLINTCCLASFSSVVTVIQSSKKVNFLFRSMVVPDPSFVLAV